MAFTLDDFQMGDLIRVWGKNTSGEDEEWDGEVVSKVRAGGGEPAYLEVNYAEPVAYSGGSVYVFQSPTERVVLASIMQHQPLNLPSCDRDKRGIEVIKGWKSMGYMTIDEDHLWRHGRAVDPCYSLPSIDDVNDLIGIEILNAVTKRCQIGCCVEKPTVSLSNQEWPFSVSEADD